MYRPLQWPSGGCLPRGCLPGGCLPEDVCQGVFAWGVSAQGGVCPGGVCPGWMSAQGGVCISQHAMGQTSPLPWTEFLTHACENITFPQLLLRTVKIKSPSRGLSSWRLVYKSVTCMKSVRKRVLYACTRHELQKMWQQIDMTNVTTKCHYKVWQQIVRTNMSCISCELFPGTILIQGLTLFSTV